MIHFNSQKIIFVRPCIALSGVSDDQQARQGPAFMIFILLFSIVQLLIYVLLLLYYRQAWKELPLFTAAPGNCSTRLSVIIPARNEAERLPRLLDALAAQQYPRDLLEVIVIDDHSTDNTAAIAKNYPGVKVIQLADFVKDGSINSYKKKAIETGIAQSSGELIVTTDADCYAGPNWLPTIAAYFEMHQPQLIVMPVAIDCSLRPIEIFQALDFMSLQGITGAAVHRKVHSMCNGANLAYTRKAYQAVDGFKDIDNIASGDDMLLMHKIALRFPSGIKYLKSPEVIVHTSPVNSVSAFLNQRIRWASKADQYKDKKIFGVLLLVYLMNVMLLVLPILAIFHNQYWWHFTGNFSLIIVWLLLLLIKTTAELFFLYPVAGFFKKQPLLWLFPLAQPFHILYTVVAGWLGKFGSYKWKGRKVK